MTHLGNKENPYWDPYWDPYLFHWQPYLVVYEISNLRFIRHDFIEKNLSSFLNYYYYSLDKINSDPYHAKSNDSENHVDLLEKLNSFTLSGEVILAFNSIRSIMKHSKPVQKRRAIYHINNIKRLIGE